MARLRSRQRTPSRVAEAYAEGTNAVLNHSRTDPAAAHVLDRIDAGATDSSAWTLQDHGRLAAAYGRETAEHLGLVGPTAAAVRMWQVRKIVYRLHPTLGESLFETDTTTKVPCDVFARLVIDRITFNELTRHVFTDSARQYFVGHWRAGCARRRCRGPGLH